MIKNSKKYIEKDDELLFINLYLLLLDFLEKKPVVFPFKLTIPENCHPILLGRYLSMQLICIPKYKEHTLKKILSFSNEFDSKNEFFQEIIPVLMLLKEISAIETIMENYYEELNDGHHDHLIDVKTGEIIEFVDEEIEKLQNKVAQKHGYKLVDHKLELYGVKINLKDE